MLERGRAAGLSCGGVAALRLYIAIAALTFSYLSNRHTLSVLSGREPQSPKAEAERPSRMTEP